MTAKQRVVVIPEEGIDGYGKKDFEKKEFQNESEMENATRKANKLSRIKAWGWWRAGW